MIKEYSQEEKEKYVKGFKSCHLTLEEYCNKMQINVQDLKTWLKEHRHIPKFGEIKVADLVSKQENLLEQETQVLNATANKDNNKSTPIKIETDTIKLELKPNFDKGLLIRLVEAIIR